jgi:hypothetical protein
MRVPAAQLGLVLGSRAMLPMAYSPGPKRYSPHILLEEDESLCPLSYNRRIKMPLTLAVSDAKINEIKILLKDALTRSIITIR